MALSNEQQQLERILLEEKRVADTLVTLLQREQASLAHREANDLLQVVAEKEKHLSELDELEAERSSLLQRAGYSPDRDGFHTMLDTDNSGRLRDLWRNVEELLKRCRQQNQINGKMLDIGRIQARQLLALLLGRENGADELYDQNGNALTCYGQNPAFRV